MPHPPAHASAALLVPVILCWAFATVASTEDASGASETPSPPQRLEDLMVLFATGGGIRASFVETRRLAILAAPIESAGVLYFAPPDRLARHTTRPGRSRVVVHGDRVAFRDETGSQTLDLGSSGAARTLIGGLMVLLRGDLAALRERYRVAFRVTGREWELDLEPRDRAARALVERTLVRGKDAELTSMETRETSGDATITEFRDVDTGIAFEDADLERIFSLRWPDEES